MKVKSLLNLILCISIGLCTMAYPHKVTAQGHLIPPEGKLYLHPESGKDSNAGTQDSPLRTINEAARRVNQANGKGAITIYLSEGIYDLDATAVFHPANWWFTQADRLTIRAEILPDDTEWNPAKMPVIISTMSLNFKPYGNQDPFGGTSYGIQIETSHVTIQGLRILGTPVHEEPAQRVVRRNYPIVREGRDLDDLRITQCLFIGDKHAIPNHCPILASGHGVVVDHCIFYNCKIATVYWFSDRPAERCEMHHCISVGTYGSAIWTWSPAEDFKFYNNVFSNSNYFWIINKDEKTTYSMSNSVVVGYNELIAKGGGPLNNVEPANINRLQVGKEMVVKKEGRVELEEDQTKRNYLHLKPGTLGADLGAGLFMK